VIGKATRDLTVRRRAAPGLDLTQRSNFARGVRWAPMSWNTFLFRASIAWLLVLIAGLIFLFFG
jgi:hypothetical protein